MSGLEDAERESLDPVGVLVANDLLGLFRGDILVVLALGSLGRRL